MKTDEDKQNKFQKKIEKQIYQLKMNYKNAI
jgi:hypothetical protein